MKPEENELLNQLQQSAAKLDEAEIVTPDIQHFRAIVDAQLARQHQAQKRQLTLFIVIAALLVSALLIGVHAYQIIFIIVQSAVVAIAAASVLVAVLKKPGERYR